MGARKESLAGAHCVTADVVGVLQEEGQKSRALARFVGGEDLAVEKGGGDAQDGVVAEAEVSAERFTHFLVQNIG